MKFVLLFCTLCGIFVDLQGKILPTAMDQIRSMASNCKTSENAATSDMDSLLGGEYPSTDAGKCLHACMQETLGIMKDGKIYVEGAIQLGKILFDNNNDAINAASEVTRACQHITDPDRCEMAVKLMHCSHAEVKKRSFGVEKLMI